MLVKHQVAEGRILEKVKRQLLSDDMLAAARRSMQEHLRELKRQARDAATSGEVIRLDGEIAEKSQRVANLTEAIASGGMRSSAAVAAHLNREESALSELRRQRDAVTPAASLDKLPDIVPKAAMDRYRLEIERMEHIGTDGDRVDPRDVIRARAALRELLGEIRLRPNKAGHLDAHVSFQRRALALVAIGASNPPLPTFAASLAHGEPKRIASASTETSDIDWIPSPTVYKTSMQERKTFIADYERAGEQLVAI